MLEKLELPDMTIDMPDLTIDLPEIDLAEFNLPAIDLPDLTIDQETICEARAHTHAHETRGDARGGVNVRELTRTQARGRDRKRQDKGNNMNDVMSEIAGFERAQQEYRARRRKENPTQVLASNPEAARSLPDELFEESDTLEELSKNAVAAWEAVEGQLVQAAEKARKVAIALRRLQSRCETHVRTVKPVDDGGRISKSDIKSRT